MKFMSIVFVILSAGAALAQSYSEPKRGTDTRAGLMDAIRPHIEWELGAPVQFVVDELRVAGDVGLAYLSPQRPGGAPIDLWTTPGARRGSIEPEYMDGASVAVLYRKLRKTWVAVHHSIGATDVWFADRSYCNEYALVIPEFC